MDKLYNIITYGCQMNVHESEKLAGILQGFSYTETANRDEADLVLLNTCCIRETAETHILGNLGIIKKLKEKKPSLIVAVCGCMTQQKDAAEKLKKRCPFIDIIFGTHNLHKFGDYLKSLETKKKVVEVWTGEERIVEDTPIHRTSGFNAWVNIMYGCNNFCSYCIVPYVRGRERSRDIDIIILDVKNLVAEGYREITLLGQNVNSYGNDFDDKTKNFASLLRRIDSEVEGKFRLRFMTSHPKDLSVEVIEAIADSKHISHSIHLPVQAGSDRILSLMNRKYTSNNYLATIDLIRSRIPDVGLSTDVMVGFPTETHSEFLDTIELLKRVRFNNVYSFIYSRRSGTKADTMDGQVDIKTKKERIKQLIELQKIIEAEGSKLMLGKTFEVLTVANHDGKFMGRTDCNKLVSFSTDNVKLGQFINVKITNVKNSGLIGEVENA